MKYTQVTYQHIISAIMFSSLRQRLFTKQDPRKQAKLNSSAKKIS